MGHKYMNTAVSTIALQFIANTTAAYILPKTYDMTSRHSHTQNSLGFSLITTHFRSITSEHNLHSN
jgi:hypothetical protein